MAATAQNHMEPLRSEGKKDEDFEEEREYGASVSILCCFFLLFSEYLLL
jgi:hypothetical protein